MIVLGVDPGTIRTGWAVVRRDGSRLLHLGSGVLRADEHAPLEQRLLALETALDGVLVSFAPDEAAVEDVFFARNAAAALKLGHARGVLLVTLARRGVPVSPYPPARVKRSIVGGGRAGKHQVQRVVQAILGMPDVPAEDEADALAVAICHANASRLPLVLGQNAAKRH